MTDARDLTDRELLLKVMYDQERVVDDLTEIKRHVRNHSDKFLKLDVNAANDRKRQSDQIRNIKIGAIIWSALMSAWNIFKL